MEQGESLSSGGRGVILVLFCLVCTAGCALVGVALLIGPGG